jgi:hypothetical protein
LTAYFADAEESSPKCNLNETFEIKDENIKVTPSLKMQGCNKTSTPLGKWYYSNLRKRSY